MVHLLYEQEIINNVLTLSAPFIKDKTHITVDTLKKAYRAYLTHLQPNCPYINNRQLFYADEATEQAFADYFVDDDVEINGDVKRVVDVNQVMYPNPEQRKQALEQSLLTLKKLDPSFHDLFHLIMNTVFCTTTQRIGGTSVNPKYLGVMCAHHDMTAEEIALPELLIHEFTHTAVSLDEHRFGHFKNYEDMRKPEHQLDGFYLQQPVKMPLNRYLHSLMVAAEVLLARDAYIGHQPVISQHVSSEKLLDRSQKYVAILNREQELIARLTTDRGQKLLNRCMVFFENYKIN